jgi:hypothetical protein
MQLRLADFDQDRFQQLAVSFGEALAEKASGHADGQTIVFRTIQACGSKPSREAMWINAPLCVLENLIPKVHRASQPLPQFPLMWKCCGKHHPCWRVYFGLVVQVR